MEMLITPTWLRSKFETEPDVDFDAGMPVHLLQSIDMFLPSDVAVAEPVDEERVLQLKHAFGLVIRQLRLRDGLTVEALAEAASVLVEELEAIEHDPHFQARPRTVVQLAKVFEIAPPKMMKLSGVAHAADETLEDEVLKFAAKSDGVSSLNSEEQSLINDFVRLLNEV